MLDRLASEHRLLGVGRRRRLVLDEGLLQRWTVGYSDILRPSLYVDRFELPGGGVPVLERRLALGVEDRVAWGGGHAARRLGGTFSGERLTLHVLDRQAVLPLTPAPRGQVHVLGVPGLLAWPGGSQVWSGGGVRAVHPLLAYAELVQQRTDRALSAAAGLREQYGWAS